MTKYYQWKQKETQKLIVEGNRFWSKSIITTILLPLLTWWLRKSNTRTLGLSWPTISRQIQDPISMHTDHNYAAKCSSEN